MGQVSISNPCCYSELRSLFTPLEALYTRFGLRGQAALDAVAASIDAVAFELASSSHAELSKDARWVNAAVAVAIQYGAAISMFMAAVTMAFTVGSRMLCGGTSFRCVGTTSHSR